MPYYTKCARCGEFGRCADSEDYNRPRPKLPDSWHLIVFHQDRVNEGIYRADRVVCGPCSAFFVLMLDDNMPHKETP